MLENNNTPHVIRGIQNFEVKPWQTLNVLTWARPSWRLHLGHYVWALKNWKIMQDNPNIKCNFLIADYQVLWDHLWETDKMRTAVVDMVIDWMAVWLDPKKSNFVVQSYVPEFAELFNYLTMFVPYTTALNNPTLKDEMKKLESKETNNVISLGFINYPVSQVADIMLPMSHIVPVWEDQIPHIELARKVIKKVNTMYDTKFPLPKALISEVSRLVWIDGNDKMSKSLGNTIYLTSSYEDIKKQVNKMYTDPNKISITDPGNIEKHVPFMYLDIFYDDKAYLEELKAKYIAGGEWSIWDWVVKKLLIETLEAFIAPIREKREYYLNHMDVVVEAIESGSKNVRMIWKEVLDELKAKMWVVNYGRDIKE